MPVPHLNKKPWHEGKKHRGSGKGHSHSARIEAVKRADRRSKRAKAIDSAITARKVYPFTKEGIKKWKENPTHTDLQGVDTPAIVKYAKRLKVKIRRGKTKGIQIEREDAKVIRRIKARKIKRVTKRKKLTGIEIENLKKLADVRGIERDLIDFEALIDRTLNYHENKEIIEDYLKGIGKKVVDYRSMINKFEGQLQSYLTELKWRAENAKSQAERIEIMGQFNALVEGA